VSDFLKRIAEFSPKRLLLLAAELEERVRALEARNRAPIAIIGVGCRFPGGIRNAETYWELLSQGRDAITEVPSWRWDIGALYDPDPHAKGRVATRWGGFLESPDLFDPAFFGIAPVEARGMDPQQRLLLEVGWDALEDAAIVPATLAGSRTGVFVGLCNSDYAQRMLQSNADGIDAYFAQGASHAVAAGRISYFLGLRGPSVAIDTACSSSLVAIHQACQSLRTGETDLVLAGGANLLFIPEVTMALSRAQMMAPDGRCKAFSAEANGFVRSEGCGIVVLKRLEDALQDGDRVIAVIRGSAVNQDGRSSGITAPNGPSQEDVIRAALEDAGVSAEAVSYVEAHGTGTSLGDLIELRALEAVLGKGRSADARLAVGSVKSNFGHAESAAGVAGLIKLALSLQHRAIPASLHCEHPNPEIDWESNHLRVPAVTEPWQPAAGETLRIGAVSSFGFSGTNAHLVVTEPPAGSTVSSDGHDMPASCVIPLSARSERALQIMAAQLADRLRENPTLPLRDVAFTLSTGRSAFAHRAAIRADSKERLIEELSLLAQGDSDQDSAFFRGVVEARKPRVAFLFAGQGGERTGMGLSLLAHSEVFRAAVAEVDAALAGTISTSIEDIFRNEHGELAQSALVQPALYAFQYGLARVWQSWGIEPQIVVGHSMGEIVACTLAGVMSVADASLLVAARGRLTQELGDPGGMVAVAVSEERALAGLAGYEADVSIAAVNGPASVVISGRSEPLEQATLGFEKAGIRVKRLNITYGSHSPAMHRVLPAFYQEAAKVRYNASRIPIIADLTGEMVADATTFNAQYFTGHLSRPVQFQRCLDRLAKEGCGLCIEMGPRAVLSTFGKERAEAATCWIASATGREDDFLALQSAVAEAFTSGAEVDWKSTFRRGRANKVSLPTYPFERERYWIEEEDLVSQGPRPKTARRIESAAHGPAGSQLDASVPIFERELSWPLPWHLADHRVGEYVAAPASVYLSLAWDAFRAHRNASLPARVLDLTISLPLQPDEETLYLQTVLTPSPQNNSFGFYISSRRANGEPWTLHATGRLETGASELAEPTSTRFDRETARLLRGEEFYQLLDERGVHLGAAFRTVRELWCLPGAAQGLVVSDDNFHVQPDAAAGPHPALLDGCFQVLGAAALDGGDTQLRLMTGIEEIALHRELRGEMLVEAQLETHDAGIYEGSLLVRDSEGKVLAHARGIRLCPVASQGSATHSGEGWLYEQAWQPAPLRGESSRANNRHWLVLGSPAGLAGTVVDRLLSAGQSAEVVSSVDELDSAKASPLQHEIVDLRAIEAQEDDPLRESLDPLPAGLSGLPAGSIESIGEAAVALTAQSVRLWQHLLRGEGRLWLFTQGASQIAGTSQIAGAMQSTLWGLARCATLEHPQRLRRIVDLDPGAALQQISSVVVRELLSEDDEEQVAYDGSARVAFRLQPSDSRNPAALDAREIFHRDGSYLLTGGAGGLGLRVAAWLGKRGAGKLVLITRSHASAAARQQEIEALRAAGVDLTIVQADVADADAMEKLLARFGSNGDLPPLRGIFHMAVEISSAPIEAIDAEQIRSTFRAKVSGTWILHQLTRTLPLDFFVAFSSTAAILGAGNLGSYAAANSFVESVAAIRAAEGLPFTSINWGTWQTMRLASREAQSQYAAGGMLPMLDDAALEWLEYLLHRGDMRQPVVANIDWAVLASLYEAKRQRHWMQFVRPHIRVPAPGTKSAWSVQPGETRLNSLERAVQKEAARVLGLRRGEVPGVNARLADLGLDSLMAVSLRNRLQQLTGHALSATFAFEYSTPARMAMALDMMLWGAGAVDEEHPAAERDEIHI
jgi:myxalamid-type polyketide synthase MxaE and MxaD